MIPISKLSTSADLLPSTPGRRPVRRRNAALRSGRINPLWLFLLASTVGVILLVVLLQSPRREAETKRLKVHCAAGLKVPTEEIARLYEEEYGVHVEFNFQGSNTLLNQIQVNKFDDSDLYLAADDFYSDLAREKGLAAEVLPVGLQRPVIVVSKTSTKQIDKLADLVRDDVRVALAHPDQAAIGKAIRGVLQDVSMDDTTLWAKLKAATVDHGVFKSTVTEIANDVKIGSVDAAIVWDSTAALPKYRDVFRVIESPELDVDPNLVVISVLNSSPQPTAALRFARYLTARDRGLPVFEQYGIRPVVGDQWAEKPRITFYCGAVNREAVQDVVTAFAKREGVVVNTSYDGCGTLTSKMETFPQQSTKQGFPDVYMACDRYFLENVKDWFEQSVDVSDTEIVLVTPMDSPVKRLEDVVKPDVRVAIGDPGRCTIGALTRRLLQKEGLYEALIDKRERGETVVEMPSSAVLLPQAVAGHVDAAFVYLTDAQVNTNRIRILHLDSPLKFAIQPLSIARSTRNKYLVQRLHRRITESGEAFRSAGFHFRLDDASPAVRAVTPPPVARQSSSAGKASDEDGDEDGDEGGAKAPGTSKAGSR